MFNLHIIQAKNGDCFILEFGSADEPKYILIDGGPSGVYKDSLSKVLANIKKKTDNLELVILSHIDADHIVGLNDLLEDRFFDEKDKTNKVIKFDDIWFNSFSNAYDIDEDVENEINKCLDNIDRILERKKKKSRSFRQGMQLNYFIEKLNVKVNRHFGSKAVTYENISIPTNIENLELNVISPNLDSLKELSAEWLDWVKCDCPKVRRGEDEEIIKADTSVPNLSSIIILAIADNKKILLTGDGFREHIIEGLKQNNFLKENEKFFVDVLKIPHHGSDNNVDPAFFDIVIADKYVISGDGSHHNPELSTLKWIVEAAKKQKRKIEIYAANKTDNIDELIKLYNPNNYGYKIKIMDENDSSKTINLSD